MATLRSDNSLSSVILTTQNEWWLKDVNDSSKNMILDVISDPLRISRKRDQAAFNPLGRRTPVVIKERVWKAREIPIQVDTVTEEDFVKLEALRDSNSTFLFQTPIPGRQWYVQFGADFDEDIENTNDPYRKVSMSFIEVAAP